MRVSLFDFQETALEELRGELLAMRVEATRRPQALSFSAPTGAGKTIIMTALFEQILFGAPGFEPQADAVILWLSDMPELNEQTRLKIEAKSDRIRVNRLRSIDSAFDAERLEGGYVYFINTQKLGTDRLLTSTGNLRQFTIWQTFANTARARPDRFYVVIDEAHRGARTAASNRQAQTIMQRFILGSPEVGMVPCPMVIGLSATPQRFEALLAGATGQITRRGVTATAEQVRGSGLLKQRVLIHHPDAAVAAELSLLQDAARRWLDMEQRWADYCQAEREERIYPILVVQVADSAGNGPTSTDLGQAVAAIEHTIGRQMREREMAHTFNDCGDLDINGRRIRKVDASRIEEDRDVGVVYFKQNLSTGWDCPRAEVMMSFRRAQDDTYIAQLLGRMVRAPLARRIDRDAALNDVHLVLPNFDAQTVQRVVDALQDPDSAPPASDIGSGRELVTLTRRAGMEDVFAALEELTTVRVNAARAQSPIRRLLALGRALANDGLDAEAGEAVKTQLVGALMRERDTLLNAGQLQSGVDSVLTVSMQTIGLDHGLGLAAPVGAYSVQMASSDLTALFERAGRQLSNGLHMDWWRAHPDRDAYEVKAELVVVCRHPGVMERLEGIAQQEFDRRFQVHRKATRRLGEARCQHYERLNLASAAPVPVDWQLPPSIAFRRKATAPQFARHLYVESDGTFKADLGTWEQEVIATLLIDANVIGWLRNVDRQPWSLEMPIGDGGKQRSMYPDLVVVRGQRERYMVDVLEPHDPSLNDNIAKVQGLAKFAEAHGAGFGRIGLVRKVRVAAGSEDYRLLNCNDSETRRRTFLVTTPEQLEQLFTDRAVGLNT